MTNPFNRADKHGAPDMRVTPPPSAETPMPRPSGVQFIPPWEMMENGHRVRGGETYAELQAINAELTAMIECALECGCETAESVGMCGICYGTLQRVVTKAKGIAE